MKNVLNYYYRIIIDDNKIDDNGYFSYNNHLFCLYKYKRNINEIDALSYLNRLMLARNVNINKIINNTFDQVITYYNNNSYVLIMINYEYSNNANIIFIPSFPNKELNILKRNNWGELWSIKVDYIEFQLLHLSNSYPLINSSVYYYIGLAENAISYFNMLDLSNIELYISHRRISYNNIYNPLELVIDYKVRDVAEYIKENFFNKQLNIFEIKSYLNNLQLDNMDCILLYVRMLYPSYYFDLYDKIINENESEDILNKVIDLIPLYEELLYEVFSLFKKKVNILGVDWINRKFR